MQTSGKNHLPISFYFHIPFCTKKCDYCHFFVLPNRPSEHARFLNALKQEWAYRLPIWQGMSTASIYFGGGTPALLPPEMLAEILSWIPCAPGTEITLEANPENLTLDLLRAFRQAGINRLSIGAQAFDDELLKILGRTHSSKATIQAIEWSQTAGFDNLSIDLMYDLPYQSLEQWRTTLATAAELPITHLSLYNLTIEPETLFFKKQAKLKPHLPDPDQSLRMYESALEILTQAELVPYEISAFARNQRMSHHNLGYWTARPFLGFGPSAYSFWEGVRFRNVAHLNKYAHALESGQDPADLYDHLSIDDRRNEKLAVELRLRCGVHLPTFEQRHGILSPITIQAITKLQAKEWLTLSNSTLSLTAQGILFYDSVAEELI